MLPIEYNEGKVYIESDGTCVISFRNQWIVGVYENETAAKKAIDLVASGNESQLIKLWSNRPVLLSMPPKMQTISCTELQSIGAG